MQKFKAKQNSAKKHLFFDAFSRIFCGFFTLF